MKNVDFDLMVNDLGQIENAWNVWKRLEEDAIG